MIQITDRISYRKAQENPLCADVGVIKGDERLWLYDVGIGEGALAEIRELQKTTGKELAVVLSHFHPDHTGNLPELSSGRILYVGENTYKYTKEGVIVTEELYLEDGCRFHIFSLPSCHAKGSLGLEINGEYAFLGDGIYPTQKGGKRVYNAQILQEEIRLLKDLEAKSFLLSHRDPMVLKKETVIAYLEHIYKKREKNSAYIEVDREPELFGKA